MSDPSPREVFEKPSKHWTFLTQSSKWGLAVRQESWQEIESESLSLGKAVTTRRGPESWVVIRKDRR